MYRNPHPIGGQKPYRAPFFAVDPNNLSIQCKEGFEKAAAKMKDQEVAILACGGDGTVTWILSDAGTTPIRKGRSVKFAKIAGTVI